ncbi:MAG: hypothetical protein LBS74_07220 [Oscillospiraceae bacterium]|jgi:hypothetical protein|nr:hypothetical protein [Oscillospiraceae bacterium]
MENYELLAKRSKKLGITGLIIIGASLFLEAIPAIVLTFFALFGGNAHLWNDISSIISLILAVTAFPAALVFGIKSIKTAKQIKAVSQGNTPPKAAMVGLILGIADAAVASLCMLINILGFIMMLVTFYVIGS